MKSRNSNEFLTNSNIKQVQKKGVFFLVKYTFVNDQHNHIYNVSNQVVKF